MVGTAEAKSTQKIVNLSGARQITASISDILFQPTFTMVFSAFLMFHNVTPSSDPPWPSLTCIQ